MTGDWREGRDGTRVFASLPPSALGPGGLGGLSRGMLGPAYTSSPEIKGHISFQLHV